MKSSQLTERKLRVRRENLRSAAREKVGAETDAAIAAVLGMEEAAFCRLINGKTQPSGKTIVKALDTFGGSFHDLFAVVDEVAA